MPSFVVRPLLLCWLAATLIEAQTKDFPQGIRDPRQPIAYIHNGTQLQALSLSDGRILWSQNLNGEPIAIFGERLIVQVTDTSRQFKVAIVDSRTGTTTSQSVEVPFSQVVRPGTYAKPTLAAKLADDKLILQWSVHGRYTAGANPPKSVTENIPNTTVEAELDMRTGEVSSEHETSGIAQDNCQGPEFSIPPKLEPAEYILHRRACDKAWSTSVGSYALLNSSADDVLVLQVRRNSLPNHETLVPLQKAQPKFPPYVTPDGGFIVARSSQNIWIVYASASGKQVGSFSDIKISEPTVAFGRIYYRSDTPPSGQSDSSGYKSLIVARDLQKGNLVWMLTLFQDTGERRPNKRPE